jgi:hypothetical protein
LYARLARVDTSIAATTFAAVFFTAVADSRCRRIGRDGTSDDAHADADSHRDGDDWLRRYGRDEAVAIAFEAGLNLLVFANQQVYDTGPRVIRRTSSPRR